MAHSISQKIVRNTLFNTAGRVWAVLTGLILTPYFTTRPKGTGLGLAVIGAGLGIGKLAAGLAEGVARQPSAVGAITGAVNLPLFLLEGVAILAEVFALLIVLLK